MWLSMPVQLKQLTEQFYHCDSAAEGTDLQMCKDSVPWAVVEEESYSLKGRRIFLNPQIFIKLRSRLGQIKNEDNIEGL